MNKLSLFIGLLILVVVGLWWWQSTENGIDTESANGDTEEVTYEHEAITVTAPTPNSSVTSPLNVSGEARGMWFFEADFPVRIFDDNGTELGVGIATAEGEWMTEDFVPFTALVEYETPLTPMGTIVFERDNPSDLAENDDSFSFPIQFADYNAQDGMSEEQTISLYFYNEALDTDSEGMVQCSPDAVVASERTVPRTDSPARDALTLLLSSGVTEAEAAAGLSSEFPLDGVTLEDVALDSSTLTVVLNDPGLATSGGSCRVTILRAQLEKTATQFATVDEVVIQPEELFQP